MLSDNEAKYLDDPEDVGSKHRSTYRNRVKDKANGPFIKLLHHIPEFVEYVSDESEERIQEEIDPFAFGGALAQLFSREDLLLITVAFAWEKGKPAGADARFKDHLPDILEEFGKDLQSKASIADSNKEMINFISCIRDEILERIQQKVELRRNEAELEIPVPAYRVALWALKHETIETTTPLQDLLRAIHSSWDEGVEGKVENCRAILIQVGRSKSVSTPRSDDVPPEEKWALHDPPMESDYEQYKAVIEGLDEEIEVLVEEYWDHQQVVERERLASKAFEAIDSLSDYDEEILDMEERTNRRGEWTRYYSRRANKLTDEWTPPLLTRNEEQDNRKQWELTAFGKFVKWCRDENMNWSDIEHNGFPVDVPNEIVREAIEQLD